MGKPNKSATGTKRKPGKASAKAGAPAKSSAKPAKAAPKAPAKPAAKTPSKPAAKAPAKQATKAKASPPVSKPPARAADAKAVKPAPAPAAPAPVTPSPSSPLSSPTARKGITIVNSRPVRKPKPRPDTLREVSKAGGQLLSPGGPTRKPLIPSGPNATPQVPLGSHAASQAPAASNSDARSTLPKKELDRFRAILIRKRAELVGDVSTMEAEALQSFSGGLSHVPQHIAEQGSDAYDQSLALDLAAADRKLIKEIDDALARIEKGTFGLCELTHKPISAQRLEELPWARYSIEAARELERRGLRA